MNSICYDYLRPKKAGFLKEWFDAPFVERTDLGIWQGSNATILPLRKFVGDNLLFGRGGVVDYNGAYVESSCINQRLNYSYEYADFAFKDEKVVYCGYLINHWGHFLVEAVARLWYFLQNDHTIDKYVFFIEENADRQIKGNYKEFLQLLGIWDKLEIINVPTRYREVIVPELGYKWRTYFSQEYLNIFNVVVNNVKTDLNDKFPEKIFLSRSALAKASNNEFGLESIDNFYERNGYKILFPEKISLSEMILYIRNAKVCASFSGSLPHNMLFANNGQKLVIIERLVLNNEIQVDVNNMRELDVTYVDANIPIYTVNMSGPFIIAFNDLMKKYAKDNGMKLPSDIFLSQRYLDKCFKKYMKSYKKEYRYQWYMLDWYAEYADYLLEAYQAGYQQFGEYLSGIKPFLLRHYFELHYIKQLIKRIIKK